MRSIRNYIYALLLGITALNGAPSLAGAQEAHGSFILKHTVHWQNVDVPAGEYRFALDSSRPFSVLTLTKLDGPRAGFVITVPEMDVMEASGDNRLVITTGATGSYVSALQLPEVGMTLNFHVPRIPEKQMAKAGSTAAASAQ